MSDITSPYNQEIIDILSAAKKPLNAREIFERAKGFEESREVGKKLNYLLNKGLLEREQDKHGNFAYWLATPATTEISPDAGNTLLRHGNEEPMPDQSEHPLEIVPPCAAKTIINDALKPCPEIDATTREMADQAEIAYETLSEALGLSPQQMCDMTLTDLAATAAALLADSPATSLDSLIKANENYRLDNDTLTEKINGVIAAMQKAPPPFSDPINMQHYLEGSIEALIAELISEQIKASEQRQTIAGLQRLLDQIRHSLDLSPAASSMDILAEIENLSRLTDRAIQIGARDAVNGPYVVITHMHSGEISDMDIARKKAELVAQSSTSGQAAVAQIIASVALVPKWSDSAQIGRHE